MSHDTPSSMTPVDWRTVHAWGLPSGSIRALLAILVFGTVWALLLVQPGAEIPDYFRDLLFIIMGHYFAARHRASEAPEPGPPPLFLPRGSVRFLLIAGSIAVAVLLFRRGQLTSIEQNPGVLTLLLVGGFLLGVAMNAATSWWKERGHRTPRLVEDVRALLSVAAAGLLIFLVLNHSLRFAPPAQVEQLLPTGSISGVSAPNMSSPRWSDSISAPAPERAGIPVVSWKAARPADPGASLRPRLDRSFRSAKSGRPGHLRVVVPVAAPALLGILADERPDARRRRGYHLIEVKPSQEWTEPVEVRDSHRFHLARPQVRALFHQHPERQKGPDRHQVEGQQVGLAERQGLEKPVRLLDRIHAHQEDDALFLVPQPELLHLAVEIELQRRRDFRRQDSADVAPPKGASACRLPSLSWYSPVVRGHAMPIERTESSVACVSRHRRQTPSYINLADCPRCPRGCRAPG